jgi:hypothetical protein
MAYEAENQKRRERLSALAEQIAEKRQEMTTKQAERNEDYRDKSFQREEARLLAELESMDTTISEVETAPMPEPAGEVLVDQGRAPGEQPNKSGTKGEWVEYAVTQGMSREEAEAATHDDLVAAYYTESSES